MSNSSPYFFNAPHISSNKFMKKVEVLGKKFYFISIDQSPELCLLKDNPWGANADLFFKFQKPRKTRSYNRDLRVWTCSVLTWKHIVHFQNQKMAPCKSSSKYYRHRSRSMAWSRLRPRNEQWGFYRENDQCALLNCECMYASLKEIEIFYL